jgi:hypothetical protein
LFWNSTHIVSRKKDDQRTFQEFGVVGNTGNIHQREEKLKIAPEMRKINTNL